MDFVNTLKTKKPLQKLSSLFVLAVVITYHSWVRALLRNKEIANWFYSMLPDKPKYN